MNLKNRINTNFSIHDINFRLSKKFVVVRVITTTIASHENDLLSYKIRKKILHLMKGRIDRFRIIGSILFSESWVQSHT